MAEEPFCPGEKYSSASRTSVRWRWRISVASRSTERAMTASVAKYSGVAVARDHLGRDRLGREAQLFGHIRLDRADRHWRRCRPRRRWRRWRSPRAPRPGARGRGRTRHRSRRASGRRWSARRGCRGCGRWSASSCARRRGASARRAARRCRRCRMSAARVQLHAEAGVEHVGEVMP